MTGCFVIASRRRGNPALFAGAWPAGEDRYYVKLGTSQLSTERLGTPEGRTVTIPEYERRDLSLYGEYGLGQRWTVLVNAPLVIESSIAGFGSAYGPGDLSLGLQRQLRVGAPWALAVRATAQLPTGDDEHGGGLLPTGSGAWECRVVL